MFGFRYTCLRLVVQDIKRLIHGRLTVAAGVRITLYFISGQMVVRWTKFFEQTLRSRHPPSSKVPDVAPRVFGCPDRDCSFRCPHMKTPSELDTVTQEAKQLLLHVHPPSWICHAEPLPDVFFAVCWNSAVSKTSSSIAGRTVSGKLLYRCSVRL